MKKKLLVLALILCLLLGTTAFSYIHVSMSSITLVFNGKKADVDNKKPPILSYNNQTYVPLRYMAEQMGAEVDYNGENKEVSIGYLTNRIVHSQINASSYYEDFSLSIFSQQYVYKENEDIRVWASFRHLGDESALIYTGEPLFAFEILSDSKELYSEILGYSLDTRTFGPNDEYNRNLLIGSEGPYRYRNLHLPKGDYKIIVRAMFGESPSTIEVRLKSEIEIRVE